MMELSKFGALFVLVALVWNQSGASLRSQRTEQAYVTLLYGDEFLLGVRVLGKSIRDTGSNKDMVVLVSDGVSDYAMKLLEADGWIVEKISLLANPNQVRPKRFWGVYTKLKIFNMTSYKKVVYLDADTIVIKSIEDLFKCGKFCANLKHSERLNSGVMVVEPSQSVFNDMMTKVNTLHSYTGGDQGFLNSYYSDFPNAHVFQPNLPQEVLNSRPVPAMERLSTLYNADVGLYMLANKTAREQLDESLPGTGGGRNPNDELLVKFLFMLPLCAVFFSCYRSFLQCIMFGADTGILQNSLCDHMRHLYYRIRSNGYAGVSSSSTFSSANHFFMDLKGFCGDVKQFSNDAQSKTSDPWTGLLLMYEWTFTIFFLLFGGFLRLTYIWGKMTAAQVSLPSLPESLDCDSGKGHLRQGSSCDVAAWYYGLGMAFLAVAAPALPCIFGITALFLRLGLVAAGGIVLASFMTYASEHLGIRSFLKGFEDRDINTSKEYVSEADWHLKDDESIDAMVGVLEQQLMPWFGVQCSTLMLVASPFSGIYSLRHGLGPSLYQN
ncbi:hypothetical protein GH714_022913 [Hevea brasiliensis]|uniref:Hexosyltransferase n=1 Tax=Hevea brasiliensis TaxID=3981 RepID=A0A6A6LZW4_HEVBR|nr:hypothetical protein GH714_022913 [Hevea brasiliensis]